MGEPSATAAKAALAGGLAASACVAAAFLAVPRHEFLPGLGATQAYQDASVVTKSDADGLPLTLAGRLARRAADWHEQGRPGAADPELAVRPPGTEAVSVGGRLVLRRPHAWLSVGWPAMSAAR
jgi:hypothetical protein